MSAVVASIDDPDGPLPVWDLSCMDWIERIRGRQSLMPPGLAANLNYDRVENARAIYRNLAISDVPGQPLFGVQGAPWMEEIVTTIHGSLHPGPVTGAMRRHLPKVLIVIPKKQGKTALGAATILTEFLLNERPYGQFILVAATQEIANGAFKNIQGMIDADPYLKGVDGRRGRLHITPTQKIVTDRKMKSTLKIMTFSANIVTGSKPAFILFDELHLLSKIPWANDVIAQLEGGMISQKESCVVYITTQSDGPPAGVFKERLDLARNIRDGNDRESLLLPIIYEMPPEAVAETDPGKEVWRDPKYWPMVMPNMGYSVTLDVIQREFKEKDKLGYQTLLSWASQHLNLQIGVKQTTTTWTAGMFWGAAGKEPTMQRHDLYRRCDLIIPGLDGGGLDDLFGMCLLGRIKKTGRWLAWFHSWVHDVVRVRRKEIIAHLEDFESQGDLTFVDDLEVAYSEIVSIILEVYKTGLLGNIAVDRAGLSLLPALLDKARISRTFYQGKDEVERLVGIPQGVPLMGPIKATEVKVQNKTLIHAAPPMMDWCVGNAKVVLRGNAVLIDKEVSGRSKIDPLMALFNSVAVMSTNPPSPKTLLGAHALETIELF